MIPSSFIRLPLSVENKINNELVYHLSDFVLEIVIEHLGSHDEDVFYVFSCLGRSLEEEMNALLLSKLLCLFLWYFSLCFSIFLVPYQKHNDIWFTLGNDFFIPVFKINECLLSCNIVCEEYAMSSSIEDLRNGLKRFLTCCVPDLKFKYLAF